MSDCRFGVSPVNYPDPDPDPDPTEMNGEHLPVNMSWQQVAVVQNSVSWTGNGTIQVTCRRQ